MKNIIKKIAILSSIFLVFSCAVSRQEMLNQTKNLTLHQPSGGNALVYVVRPAGYGGFVKFNVFVDDKNKPQNEVGYTKGSQYIYFYLKPGKHKIFSKAENWSEIVVNAKAGETLFIKQKVSMGIFMARNKLEIIDELSGRYAVKKGSVGTVYRKYLR